MGVQGVKFDVDRSRLIECIKEKKGVLMRVAKELGYTQETIIKYVKLDPEITQIVAEARKANKYMRCEACEDYLFNCLSQTEDRSNGLRAAIYYLNNNGKEFGYAHPTTAPADGESAVVERLLKKYDALHDAPLSEQPLDHNDSRVSEELQ